MARFGRGWSMAWFVGSRRTVLVLVWWVFGQEEWCKWSGIGFVPATVSVPIERLDGKIHIAKTSALARSVSVLGVLLELHFSCAVIMRADPLVSQFGSLSF